MNDAVITQLPGAKAASGSLPPLVVQARHLAGTLIWGNHGRRRSGVGDTFWQYRQAQTGDVATSIDWRRSARADEQFVRETEWQVAQSLQLWVDPSLSMEFGSGHGTKGQRAQLLGLVLADLAQRAGEAVGTTGLAVPAKAGAHQVERLALLWAESAKDQDFGAPDPSGLRPGGQAVLISDFFGDMDHIDRFLAQAARRSVQGVMVQVLDPQETQFPFRGRSLFRSMGGGLEFESQQALSLKDRYLDALAQRQTDLKDRADLAGWSFVSHTIDAEPRDVLLSACAFLGSI